VLKQLTAVSESCLIYHARNRATIRDVVPKLEAVQKIADKAK
jgi:hypothetical protein